MTVSVLIPFYADDSPAGRHRAAVWAWCRRRWDILLQLHLIDELVIGRDPLVGRREFPERGHGLPEEHSFSVARAINDAASHAHGDNFLIFGADHVPDTNVAAWAPGELNRYPFVRIFDRIAYASEATTRIILSTLAFPLDAADWHETSAPCPGVIGVRRSAFEAAGGMNESFEGWGYEDSEFLGRLQQAHPGPTVGRMRASGWTLRELWHDGGHRDLNGPNKAIYEGMN